MTDPFSVAAGAAGLISLGVKVTESLVEFYTTYKNQDSDVARLANKLEDLLHIFRILHDTLQSRKFRPNDQSLVEKVESFIHRCQDLIQELRDECNKLEKASKNSIKDMIKITGRRAAYPFRKSTLQKLDEDIDDIRDNLSLALDMLQLKDHSNIQDEINDNKALVETVGARQVASTIRDWLKAPDVSINHNSACVKRHPGTGI